MAKLFPSPGILLVLLAGDMHGLAGWTKQQKKVRCNTFFHTCPRDFPCLTTTENFCCFCICPLFLYQDKYLYTLQRSRSGTWEKVLRYSAVVDSLPLSPRVGHACTVWQRFYKNFGKALYSSSTEFRPGRTPIVAHTSSCSSLVPTSPPTTYRGTAKDREDPQPCRASPNPCIVQISNAPAAPIHGHLSALQQATTAGSMWAGQSGQGKQGSFWRGFRMYFGPPASSRMGPLQSTYLPHRQSGIRLLWRENLPARFHDDGKSSWLSKMPPEFHGAKSHLHAWELQVSNLTCG